MTATMKDVPLTKLAVRETIIKGVKVEDAHVQKYASPGSADVLSTIIATLPPHGGPDRSFSNAATIGSRSDNQG